MTRHYTDAEDYASSPQAPAPLFERNLFAGSQIQPTGIETAIAHTIALHRGRRQAISIAEIITGSAIRGLTERQVKRTIENLRRVHRLPIGSRRTVPHGYFWIVDADDLADAVRAYKRQVVEMFRTLRAVLAPERLREFYGQLLLEPREGTDGDVKDTANRGRNR